MTPGCTSDPFSRRDFIRLLLASGGAVSLAPLLKACGGAPGAIEATAVPPPAILKDLEGIDIDTFF